MLDLIRPGAWQPDDDNFEDFRGTVHVMESAYKEIGLALYLFTHRIEYSDIKITSSAKPSNLNSFFQKNIRHLETMYAEVIIENVALLIKCLTFLQNRFKWTPSGVFGALQQKYSGFKGVRDSIQHIDERVLGKSYGKDIKFQNLESADGRIKMEKVSIQRSFLDGAYTSSDKKGILNTININEEIMVDMKNLIEESYKIKKWWIVDR